MSHNRIRTFNKYVTNRILRRFASFSHGPFAVIRHVGRWSGRPYETTIMVRPRGEDFVIVLTYGPEVDWYRNLLAAGQATLLWHGETYTIGKPESMDRTLALLTFSPFLRFMLWLLNSQHFVRVKSSGPELVKT